MTTPRFSQSDLPSGAESRESHLAFIRQNLDIAAAVAWQGYQHKGRCAILIVTRWSDERQPWTAGITPACVLPRKRVLCILDDANPLAQASVTPDDEAPCQFHADAGPFCVWHSPVGQSFMVALPR